MDTEPLNIYTISDLNKLVVSGTIHGNIIIRGEQMIELNGIEKIIGSLGISCSTLTSIGEIREVTGDLWISTYSCTSQITNLGKLESVGGNCRLRYSNIKNLGCLSKVGGDLILRDSPIENFGTLNFVGGNLFLPKRIQNELDVSKISIQGTLRFWNDDKTRKNDTIEKLFVLKTFSGEVPQWNHQYIYSINDLAEATNSQKQFYNIFKYEFKKGNYLDLKGYYNYSFVLVYDLLTEYEQHQDINVLKKHLEILEKYYPKTKGHTTTILVEQYKKKGDFLNAWNLLNEKDYYIGILTILEYEHQLGKSLLEGKLIARLGGTSHLTQFGRDNISNIIPYINIKLGEYEKEKGSRFFDLFFINGEMYPKKDDSFLARLGISNKSNQPLPFNERYDVDYYKQFYLSESEFEFYKDIDSQGTNLDFNPIMTHVVEKAIFNQFRLMIKHSEDLYRESIGMPKIGEGWISEMDLYYKIKMGFENFNVIPHGSPKWLGRQHLDVYLPELNIGIEYQGAQHYEPIDFFGGEEAFIKNIERDIRKRELCAINDCKLIYVTIGYDFSVVKKQIDDIITVHDNGS